MDADVKQVVHSIATEKTEFYGNTTPHELVQKFGSPLYVYNESVLRTRCRELVSMVDMPGFRVNYSAKANTNPALLTIVREEGLLVDAMSPGEIFIEMKAGFTPEEILYIGNNVSDGELQYAIEAGVTVSVDSISQCAAFGRLNPGGNVAVRINPGVGAGHHEKVVTGGKNTKFGVDPIFTDELKATIEEYDLHLIGLNQHIGSLFLTPEKYFDAVRFLLSYAEQFPELEFVDFGGGFGIPYRKEAGEGRLDLTATGKELKNIIEQWIEKTGRELLFKIEPGRYTVAECGVLLGTVHALKENGGNQYAGTDIGFNVLARQILYDAHHDIEVYGDARNTSEYAPVTIVGNICESGDIITKNRSLPHLKEGDVIGALDAGAYGMVMASNYNSRLRPAEVLITRQGEPVLIRERDTLEDLVKGCRF